jgi:hypothetical protein
VEGSPAFVVWGFHGGHPNFGPNLLHPQIVNEHEQHHHTRQRVESALEGGNEPAKSEIRKFSNHDWPERNKFSDTHQKRRLTATTKMQLMTGFSQMSRLWSRTTKASYGLMTREMRSSLVSGLFFGSPALVFLFQGHKLESKFVTLSMAHTIRLRSRQELTCANNLQLAQPPNNACVQESGIQRCHQRVPPSQNTNKPGRIRYLLRSEESACVA